MGKRSANGGQGGGKKKFKLASGIIEPGQAGVLATCQRGKEQGAAKELRLLFGDKVGKYFDLEDKGEEEVEKEAKGEEQLSVEDAIKKELSDMATPKTDSREREIIKSVDLGCDCLVFIKTRRPIVPSELVQKLCREALESKQKSTRFSLRLTPIDASCTPTEEELKKLAQSVLAPVFHKEEQEPYKFAVVVTKRNFNSLEQHAITRIIAGAVGKEKGHSVDLKNPDKIILVNGYKSNIGIAVVDGKEHESLCRFNLQQIFEKSQE